MSCHSETATNPGSIRSNPSPAWASQAVT
ncbi:CxxxxCH/CxxCH domain-containing protein [Nonomuraea sp. NPDC050153]